MKRAIFVLAALAAASAAWAAPERFSMREPDSRLTFEGHSPLHSFSGTTSAMNGKLSADWGSDKLLEDAVVRVPVASLKTGNEARDHAVQFTARAAGNPEIVFKLHAARPQSKPDISPRRYRLAGTLEVGGVSKALEMDAEAFQADGVLRVSGEADMAMSDFNLKPPPIARLLGLEDRVHVHWDTVWAPGASRV